MAKKTEKDRKKQKKLDKLNAPSQSDEKVCREGTDLLEIHVRWCAHPSRNRLISPVHALDVAVREHQNMSVRTDSCI